ncbi:MAG: hypothetical protein ABIN67_08050 [Ferruginibacter sp.]
MKFVLFFFVFAFLATGCGLREREQELDKKVADLNQKEQELLLKEKSLQLKEQELAQKEKLLDSSSKHPVDSTIALYPQLEGKWDVTMRCTETNCTGSAVGDTKNEQWQIGYQNGGIVVEAFSGNKLVRIYSGSSNGNTIELSAATDTAEATSAAKMIVRIKEIKGNEMTGQREIIRPENCQILYSLEFKKL